MLFDLIATIEEKEIEKNIKYKQLLLIIEKKVIIIILLKFI